MMILEMILYILRAMHIDSAIKESRELPSMPPPPQQAAVPDSEGVVNAANGAVKQKTL